MAGAFLRPFSAGTAAAMTQMTIMTQKLSGAIIVIIVIIVTGELFLAKGHFDTLPDVQHPAMESGHFVHFPFSSGHTVYLKMWWCPNWAPPDLAKQCGHRDHIVFSRRKRSGQDEYLVLGECIETVFQKQSGQFVHIVFMNTAPTLSWE